MSDDKIKFGKDGKPTSESMEYLFKTDRDKFLQYQDEYFTTKSGMKDYPFKGVMKKIIDKAKEKKDAK